MTGAGGPASGGGSRIAITLEERFQQTPDGSVYSSTGMGDDFWKRYTDVFGPVSVVARVARVETPHPEAVRIGAPGVSFRPLDFFAGGAQLALKFPRLRAQMSRALADVDGVILRLPSTTGLLAEPYLKASGKPFAVEAVSEEAGVYGTGLSGLMLALVRGLYAGNMRRLCARASAAAYVTRELIQRRYPPAPGAPTTHYSSITLAPEDIRDAPRTADSFTGRPLRLLMVGTMAQHYKGHDVLIEAVRRLVAEGRDLSLRMVGDGRLREPLEQSVATMGLGDRISFLGRISRRQVFVEMDDCHLYVQPSRTEGLPRTIIEAFARAAPAVATRVAGIPELVPERHLVAPDDPVGLAAALAECMDDPYQLAAMSKRNLALAAKYRSDVLAARRRAFYEAFDGLLPQRRGISNPR